MDFPFEIFPIDSKPFGLSYSEWSELWWKWILNVPKNLNPLLDDTGAFASTDQSHPHVFFLCQTHEQTDYTPSRKVRIPPNKSLFLPVINWISVMGVDGGNDDELIRVAKMRMDVISNLKITIDEVKLSNELKNFRAFSRVFDVTIPVNNILDLPSGSTRAVSDGYWLFVQPKRLIKEVNLYFARFLKAIFK